MLNGGKSGPHSRQLPETERLKLYRGLHATLFFYSGIILQTGHMLSKADYGIDNHLVDSHDHYFPHITYFYIELRRQDLRIQHTTVIGRKSLHAPNSHD
jgi:hypothetical protein